MAKDKGTDIIINTNIPENIALPENDLSVVLGNLIQNAVEACAEQINGTRSISVKAKTTDSSIFITVDNTFEGKLKKDKNGEYISTKKHGSGLGIASVKSTVSRYEGTFLIEEKEGMFCVSLMLPLPEHRE